VFASALQGFLTLSFRSLKSSVGPAVLKKPCIVVYLILEFVKNQHYSCKYGYPAAFLCNNNTKPVHMYEAHSNILTENL
jgi:hypothetical protein